MRRFPAKPGDRVAILPPHPWAGSTGRVSHEETFMGEPSLVVDIEGYYAGCRAGIVRPEDIRLLPDSEGGE